VLVAGVLAAPLALVAGLVADTDATRVVVHDRSGERVAGERLPSGGRFSLTYLHSYYRAPAEERFVAEGDGFRLESVASPRVAVLDYYELRGRRTREGRWLRLYPRARRHYRRLPLIATAQGRRTLVVGGRRLALYGGRARHLEISVERR
jgi:hypothetical protein